jgi:beta-lactamase regulating signal transducer with metallopeptidase domain
MKTVVILLLAIMSTVIYSQNAQQAATIEINGAKLRLGMTKGDVAEKLAGANIHKITEDLWVIGDISPSMQFTAGRLTFADRTWSKTEALAEPLYGVVSAFHEQGYTRCDISADTKVTPQNTSLRTWIDCGDKRILVIHIMMNGKSYDWVSEQLGHMKDAN